MKHLIIILFLLAIIGLSCKDSSSKQDASLINQDTKAEQQFDLFDTTTNQIHFITLVDTIKFNENFINQLRKEFPEIEEVSKLLPPYKVYKLCSNKIKTNKQKQLWSYFENHEGENNFLFVYAYLFKKKNFNPDYTIIRQDLIELLQLKNKFNSIMYPAEKYHKRKSIRIYADVEYEIQFLIKENININTIPIEYNKKQYLNDLKSLVDEVGADKRNRIPDVATWKQELLDLIEELEPLLTNHYYLKRCVEFG